MMWWMALVLHLSSSHAQLTPPHEAVCSGQQVLFVCQQLQGDVAIWTVNLGPGMMLSVHASIIVGRVETFPNDPGYEFEVTTTDNNTSFTSELSVTAAKELNGVTVECRGFSGTYTSEILIASDDPPAAPSGVMTSVNNTRLSHFTLSTASITLTWSTSSEADNYTIMVTPPLPSGPSSLSTTTTSLQLIVLYNEQYSINITAHNCAGNNGTTVPLIIVSQCGPPTSPVNGHINSNYSSTVEGSQVTFHCSNDSPGPVMTSTCTNGKWIPNPVDLNCGELPPKGSGNIQGLSATTQVLITAVVCSLFFFILGILVGTLFHYWATVRCMCKFKQSSNNSPAPPAASAPVVYEEVSPDSHTGRKCDIELKDNVAYGPVV